MDPGKPVLSSLSFALPGPFVLESDPEEDLSRLVCLQSLLEDSNRLEAGSSVLTVEA